MSKLFTLIVLLLPLVSSASDLKVSWDTPVKAISLPVPQAEPEWTLEQENILARARVENHDGLAVIHLTGTPYEIGFQHGALLRKMVRKHYEQAIAIIRLMYTRPNQKAEAKLDKVWEQMAPHVPADHLEEMRGLADGAGVKLELVQRVHAIPEVFSTMCANGVFFGKATVDGRLYHVRNLDWNRIMGAHKYGVVFAVSPLGKKSFVNIGFAGFTGAVTGINENGISVGQVGSSSADETHKGTSFTFLIKRILEEAGTADQAAAIVKGASRTVGINYVIGSALEKRALALESTAKHFAQFKDNDPEEGKSPYALLLQGGVFRADTAFDPTIRTLQTCSKGDGKTADKSPKGSNAYDTRYCKQGELAQKNYGKIGKDEMMDMAKAIAPASNIKSVIFAYPDLWVSYAQGNAKASEGPFHHFDLKTLLR